MSEAPWDLDAQRPDVAVLVVLKEEFRELRRELSEQWFPRYNQKYSGYDYFWIDPMGGYRCMATFVGRMSPEEATHYTNRLLEWDPAVVVNIGIAAGLHSDVRIGDVIVPDSVCAYDKTSKVKPKTAPHGEVADDWEKESRSDTFRATHDLVERIKHLDTAHQDEFGRWQARGASDFALIRKRSPKDIDALLTRTDPVIRDNPEILVETLASGHAVVAAQAFAAWVRSGNAEIKALEMEAAGMLLAAEKRVANVDKLVIRGISDHTNATKVETEAIEAGALRGLAMRNAWRLFKMLMELEILPRAGGLVKQPNNTSLEPRTEGRTSPWWIVAVGLGAAGLGFFLLNFFDQLKEEAAKSVAEPVKSKDLEVKPSIDESEGEAELIADSVKPKEPEVMPSTDESRSRTVKPAGDPIEKICPAEVGDYPAPYFMDTVLIRLPKGVTEENFVEFTPGVFARLSSAVDSVSCVQDVPGATISFMAMTVFQDNPVKSVAALRDEAITAFGYDSPKLSEERIDDAKRAYEGVVDVEADPANGKPEPAKALFVLKSGHGNMYAIVYETHPNAWNALQLTFRESAKKVSLLSP